MDLEPIVARLQTTTAVFRRVGGAADLAAIESGPPLAPACYVMPLAEEALEDIPLLGGFAQALGVVFGVVVLCANRRDARGEAVCADLRPLRQALRAALLGWSPEPDVGEPVHFAGGRLLRFDDGLLWWIDEFRVKTYWRSV